jgi:hypothetical protein
MTMIDQMADGQQPTPQSRLAQLRALVEEMHLKLHRQP